MPFTNYALSAIMVRVLGSTALTPPATYYVGLSSTTPTQVATSTWNVTEPSIGVNAYARVAVTNNTTNFGPISVEPSAGYTIQNLTAITFTASTGAWGSGATYTNGLLWDASSGGNLWAYGLLTPSVVVNASGYQPSFAIGQFVVTWT